MNKVIKSLLFVCILGLCLCFLYFSYFQKQPPKLSVIYIPKTQDSTNDFWTTLISGTNMAADEYNIDLTILSPSDETDYEQQNKLMKEAAEQHPDALAVSPISYTESTQLLKKIKQTYHIPIILIDTVVSESIEDSLIASDNYAAGKTMGEFALNYVKEDSKIGIVSHVPNTSTAIEREKGFRAGLGDKEGNVVETVYSYSDFQTAYDVTVDLLKRYPDLSVIAGLNEYSAVGAGNAIKDLGLSGQVRVIGFDNSIAAIRLLEEDIFSGIIIQKSFNMGYLGIKTAYQILNGETVEMSIDSGTELITREDIYTKEGQQALFSFLQK